MIMVLIIMIMEMYGDNDNYDRHEDEGLIH